MTTLRPRDEVEGSGMGLALVKKIISFYGGRLDWVDNASGRGTGFVVHLPLVSARVIS
jgi:signal transduction histidine kinase